MSEVVKFSINGDTNAEQVTDKVKKSVSNLEKNIQGIEARFKSFGKDLFLSMAAPMVILNKIINEIDASIAKSREQAKKGFEEIAAGENKVATEREVRMARFVKMQADKKEEEATTAAGRAEAAGRYVDENQMDFLLNKPAAFFAALMGEMGIGKGFGYEFVQKAALERFEANTTPEQKKAAEEELKLQNAPTTFKSPEGFSNVVGVGASPMLEAMTQQLEQAKLQTLYLQQIASGSGGGNPPDFSKTSR
jgi:hypothetical protein